MRPPRGALQRDVDVALGRVVLIPGLRDRDELREDHVQRRPNAFASLSVSLTGQDLLEGLPEVAREPRVNERIEHRVQVTSPGDDREDELRVGNALKRTVISKNGDMKNPEY